jgi:hypothetical protein
MSTKGYDLEDYHRRLRNGELLPHTPFEQVELRSSRGTSTIYASINNTGCKVVESTGLAHTGGYWSVPPPEPTVIIPDLRLFVQAAAGIIHDKGHDTLTFAAELRKTASMFQGVANRWLNLVRGLSLGKASKLWLEARYGWRTLYYDLEDLNDALRNFDDKRKRWSERAGTSYNTVTGSTYTISGAYYQILRTNTLYWNVSCRGSVVADIQPQQFRFSPLQTAWELVPYSFVLDWFIGVGDALSAIHFLSAQENYQASGGYRVQCHYNSVSSLKSVNTGYSASVSTTQSDSYVEWTRRTPMPVPYLPFNRVRLNLLKLADLVALLINHRNNSGNRRRR